MPADIAQESPVNWPRINRGMNYALRHYPGVVGQILADELDSWAHNGYRFGGKQLIERLLTHLEKLDSTIASAGEDIGCVVHRTEVEG